MAIQSDGKILVAGTFGSQTGDNFVVVRYNSNGSLDTNFDGDGIVRTVFVNGDHAGISGLKIQPDGKILVAGNTGFPKRVALARYNPNGSLDTTFDTDGKVDFPLFNNSTNIYDVAIQPNGGIVVVGSTLNFSDQNHSPAVVCLNSNGSLNTSFDGDGIAVILNQATDDIFYGVAVQPNNKIVAAGYTSMQNSFSEEFAVARYLGDLAPPTAANVSISGQVLSSNNQGISRVSVSLTDSSGNIRTATTNSFGNYRFEAIPTGQTYVVSVNHKKYVFSPASQILKVSEDLTSINFTANE